MSSGWNLWVWLPCIGVVSGCCCKEVYRYFPYSTCISSFLAAASLLLCSFLKCFFGLVSVIFLQYICIANVTQRTFEIIQKKRDHANIIIIIKLAI